MILGAILRFCDKWFIRNLSYIMSPFSISFSPSIFLSKLIFLFCSQEMERPKEPGLSALRTIRELQEGMVGYVVFFILFPPFTSSYS